jgi:WD40 repeat protein
VQCARARPVLDNARGTAELADIEVREAATGEVRQVLAGFAKYGFIPAWHPNGQILAGAGGGDRLILIWDVRSGKVIQKLEGHKNLGINCAFDRTGDRLLSNDWSSVLRLWEPSSGKQLLSVRTHNHNFLRISPDGRVPAMSVLDPTKLQLWRVPMGLEYRTLALSDAGDGDSIQKILIQGEILFHVHPQGRLLAASASAPDSVRIVDLAEGRLVATLGAGTFIPSCWDGSEDLLTCGPAGLLRWPLRADPGEPGHYRFGPPTRLFEDHANAKEVGISADTQVVGIPANNRGAVLIHRGPPIQRIQLQPQQDVRSCSVSPDGRWVASGSHNSSDGLGAKVWNADTGELVKAVPVSGMCRVAFSPDSRWLLTTGGGCRLWKAGAWDNPRTVGGTAGCFSPDSGMLAVDDLAGAIRLVSTATGDTLARLEAPEQANSSPRGFTPAGAKLLAVGGETSALHIWDLRLIRKGLLELGLETGLPEYAPAKETGQPPIRVDVELTGDGRRR